MELASHASSGDRSDCLVEANYVKLSTQRGNQQCGTSVHQVQVFGFNNMFGHRMPSMKDDGMQLGVGQFGIARSSANM